MNTNEALCIMKDRVIIFEKAIPQNVQLQLGQNFPWVKKIHCVIRALQVGTYVGLENKEMLF